MCTATQRHSNPPVWGTLSAVKAGVRFPSQNIFQARLDEQLPERESSGQRDGASLCLCQSEIKGVGSRRGASWYHGIWAVLMSSFPGPLLSQAAFPFGLLGRPAVGSVDPVCAVTGSLFHLAALDTGNMLGTRGTNKRILASNYHKLRAGQAVVSEHNANHQRCFLLKMENGKCRISGSPLASPCLYQQEERIVLRSF